MTTGAESPVIQTLAGLVHINSVNPAYEGGQSESEIVEFIEAFFSEQGIETWRQEVLLGRPNLIARLAGARPGRLLVLEAHTDTASVAGMAIRPFAPEIAEGRLYGRGSCDTKAGLAAMMQAMASLKREGKTPPCAVWVVAAADEEYSFRGVLRLSEDLRASGAVVSEPTGMRLITASKGCVRWRITTIGKAAHSSKPYLGVNAIEQMARVILALQEDSSTLGARYHALLGSPTCNIGLIHGGTQVNVVPEACWIEVDRRLIPGEEVRDVLDHYRAVLGALPAASVSMESPMLEDYPLDTPADSSIAVVAGQVLGDMGLNPEPAGVPFGSDASKLSRAGVPSIIAGPGSIDQAHAAIEYVECEQVEQALEFYRRLMLAFEG